MKTQQRLEPILQCYP